jgi:hypothetical protein
MSLAGVPSHRLLARGWRGSVLLAALAAAGLACALTFATLLAVDTQSAQAVILTGQTIDGPSSDIVGFGGVAMAEDGTGGLVYLKRVNGVPQVFVSRFAEGHWSAPIRVEPCHLGASQQEIEGGHCKEPYAASWPRIGAANGGELIVVWATPFATRHEKSVYELLASELGPGSPAFGPAIIVDSNIEEATGTSPDLAVSSTGQADVVYRVVETSSPTVPLLRPGDVVEQVRVAHFDGQRWSNLGAINRDPGVSMRPPTEANAPKIAIGPTGSGVVVWQEPDIEGVARIWARRLFGSTLDYVMLVSAETYNGAPIATDADAPSVAVSWLGQADVAYRQNAGQGSPLPGPRIFLNILPNGESKSGGEFEGPIMADSAVPGGQSATVGPPSIDIDEKEDLRILYDENGTPRVIEGDDHGLTAALSLGPPFVGAETQAVSVMNVQGGGVSAWPSANAQGDPAVAVREDFPGGAVQTGLVSGGAGGEVAELAVGRSGLGDGLIAFRQGPFGAAAIVAAQATAPPAELVLSVPKGWVKPSQAVLSWQPAVSADGPLRYTVVLDGHRQATPEGAYSMHLDPLGLGSGRHTVQLLATDIDHQSALSKPSTLLIDGAAPAVTISRAKGGYGVSVRVSKTFTAIDVHNVTVSFGDGHTARGRKRFSHLYAHGGVYRVIVHVRDKLGNTGVVSRLVKVR